jgi:copper chaperone CopZ
VSCADAVRAGLLNLPGILEVKYLADQDLFAVNYESVLVSLETIFAAVFTTGKQLGQDYFPEAVG